MKQKKNLTSHQVSLRVLFHATLQIVLLPFTLSVARRGEGKVTFRPELNLFCFGLFLVAQSKSIAMLAPAFFLFFLTVTGSHLYTWVEKDYLLRPLLQVEHRPLTTVFHLFFRFWAALPASAKEKPILCTSVFWVTEVG